MLAERAPGLELIDGPVDSIAELSGSFRDIALANRLFGGVAAANFALRSLAARSVLDVGTGIGDIPASLSARARRSGTAINFTCVDSSSMVLHLARTQHAGDDRLTFLQAQGQRLPFDDASFDVAMCNLTLHHLAPTQAVCLLRELRRVARIAPVVTDLRRSEATYLATLLFSRALSRNRLTRHDAPLSALRAYTIAEAVALAVEAGWAAPRATPFGVIRYVLTDDARV